METDSDADADSNVFPQLMLIVILTLLNAFFASAELAILSVNKNRIKYLADNGNKKAKAVEKLNLDQTKFLSTIQVGITLAGFFSSATAAIGLSGDLGVFLQSIHFPKEIAVVIVTLALSYISLVFGELFPKRIALRVPEKVAMFSARPILFVKIIASPFVRLLSASTNLLVKITGLEQERKDDRISEEEIKSYIESGVEEGAINSEEQKMIESIFKFNDLEAADVMTPRVDVFMIDIDDKINKYLDKIIGQQYTRVPVYQESRDNILGILNLKDLLAEARKVGFSKVSIRKIIRPPYFARDTIKINILFKKMQATKNHIACLTDEFGGFRGIVTLEDLVEEIMGNINDEYDDNPSQIIKQSENIYLVNATISIHDLNKELELDFDETNDEYDSLGGLIITLIHHIPHEGEDVMIDYQNVTLKVEKIDGNRIAFVKVIIHK